MHEARVPAGAMLGRPLAVQRSLRPLKRRVAVGRHEILDEEATAAYIADSGHWIPVLTPTPQRWLDLVLVIDTGPSMSLWHPLVSELRTTLGQLGAFRDIRVSYLASGRILNAHGAQPRDPATLVDPAGRRAILVFSDCSGPQWWRGGAAVAVRTWARRGPTAIVQPLPERMWQRTAAPAITGWATARQPGASGSELIFTPDATGWPLPRSVIPVPVLELAPVWLNDWARLVASPGRGAVRTAVTCFPPGIRPPERRVERETELSVDDRVRRFRAAASPEAVRLAAHIAVSTPALPVMRLIQRTMVPESRPSHLAEVLLSGLLRPVSRQRYEFVDERTRKELLAALPRSESWHAINVLRQVSADIEQRAGTAATTFGALLEIVRDAESTEGEPFALVSREAVAALSNLAVPVRRKAMPEPAPAPARGGRERPSPVLAGPYFFLSYAHVPRHDPVGPDPNEGVIRLFNELCEHVLALTSLPHGGRVGFMDREPRPGVAWPEELSQALATCRVFVPLYSQRFFASGHCGKEWWAFAMRMANQTSRGAGPAGAIVPALWTPVEPSAIPEVARSIQFNHRELGQLYATEGLYGLSQLEGDSAYRAAYQKAVFELAKRIVNIAELVRLAPGQPLDYETAVSAFGGAHDAVPGVRQLRITIVAPPRDDLPAGRGPSPYGRNARDWNPYYPDSRRTLADHAADLARSLGYRPLVGDLDERDEAPAGGRPSSGPNMPEILLVDPWATVRPEGRLKLERFNNPDEPWIQAIVPWNLDDGETAGARGLLEESIEASLGLKLARGRATRPGVSSLEGFSAILPVVVSEAFRHYLKNATAYPPDGPSLRRPRLRGPESESRERPDPERTDG